MQMASIPALTENFYKGTTQHTDYYGAAKIKVIEKCGYYEGKIYIYGVMVMHFSSESLAKLEKTLAGALSEISESAKAIIEDKDLSNE